MKSCPGCLQVKGEDSFYRRSNGRGVVAYCKPCHNKISGENQRKRRMADPAGYAAYREAYLATYKPPTRAVIKCEFCACDVSVHTPSQLNRKRFCSRACRSKWLCGKYPDRYKLMIAGLTPEARKRQVAGLKRGPDHPMWIDGRSGTQRPKAPSKKWRESVFARDKYTCQMCHQRGGKLQADHIKPYATHHDLRWDVDNGRTLCVDCHKQTPTFGAKLSHQLRIERLAKT